MSSKNLANGATKPASEVKNGFTIPKWAGKPPAGLHLDVMKEGKMIQKLMIDEKKCYFFGRNQESCDFVTDHASCSRVHAVLVWHKDLARSFLVDLNSTHGTFIGSLRLEANKPQQVFLDSELKFGASTRTYIIRERPHNNKNQPSILNNSNASENDDNEDSFTQTLTLPESELELDNLTEFNTAHNKRIAQLVDISSGANLPSVPGIGPVKKKKKTVVFKEEEDIINPEDIDPSIGRFRNLVQTTVVVPRNKRPAQMVQSEISEKKIRTIHGSKMDRELTLYEEHEEYNTIGFKCLNSAPDVDTVSESEPAYLHYQQTQFEAVHGEGDHDDHKKRYAKESWPGRHSTSNVPATTTGSPTHTKRLII
ncbi:nuclear inhibitor of phosphatase 1 [Brachionus plicatilis]|uniref:Nuclear inhibitor of phosphatase 1 n=1 Tax=Brachionus plicatilis TaxID=10195 RepID=A0A3M7PF46_BRAPC|nr:nuclear inhibitor of phosphatase 1 [Brachionus plicatilis]